MIVGVGGSSVGTPAGEPVSGRSWKEYFRRRVARTKVRGLLKDKRKPLGLDPRVCGRVPTVLESGVRIEVNKPAHNTWDLSARL